MSAALRAHLSAAIFIASLSGCSSDHQEPTPPCRKDHPGSGAAGTTTSTTPGQITLGGTITSCPQVTSIGVVPERLPPDQDAALVGDAVDLDNDTLSFLWNATAGIIAAPRSARTTYRCTTEGFVTVTLVVTDGNCEDKLQASVECIR